jgi:hypothetical protein
MAGPHQEAAHVRPLPPDVGAFLEGRRIAVAGVSRAPNQPANLIFRKLRAAGHEVFAVNPSASEVEGGPCYGTLRDVPGPVDGLMIAAPPGAALELVRQASELGIRRVWFHRSFGQGSVSDEAVKECRALGITCIVGGCPMMYCAPVDIGHRCMRWVLRLGGKVPG